ncbi:hypothetical protein LENED_006587 [Lentinula edodes]|uniref:Uncharacterized protein n=1 Tax=Lentinula edodes TaxID=5353 RepID=A0A1Q3EC27_LENED|nr:hypothetical protein LENED_006587 [Lentinula edodes]
MIMTGIFIRRSYAPVEYRITFPHTMDKTPPELSSPKSDTPVTPTMGQSALDSKASNDLKLTKQATTNSESPTLVAKEQVKQDSDLEQKPKGSVISRFGKRVLDGYNKKASKVDVPVEMLYKFA